MNQSKAIVRRLKHKGDDQANQDQNHNPKREMEELKQMNSLIAEFDKKYSQMDTKLQ